MKTLRLFRRDMDMGVLKRAALFLIPVIVAAAQAYVFKTQVGYYVAQNDIGTKGTVMDYYIYATQGMWVYHFDPKQYFYIPIYWFVFQIGISYITAYYAYNDFVGNGRSLVIAARNRGAWWRGKCLWCMTSVLIYYVVSFLTTAMAALGFGAETSLDYTEDICVDMLDWNFQFLVDGDVRRMVFFAPFLVTMGICMAQLLLSFLLSPVMSFACACAVYVLSAYYTVWFLPGSYTMWLRSSYLTQGGVRTEAGILMGAFFVVAVFYMGHHYFEKKDIL